MSSSLRTQILEALEMSYEQQLTDSGFGDFGGPGDVV